MPRDLSAINKPAVPVFVAIQYLQFKYFDNFFSKSFIEGPFVETHPSSIALTKAFLSFV